MVKEQTSMVKENQILNMYYTYAAVIVKQGFLLIDGVICFSAINEMAN